MNNTFENGIDVSKLKYISKELRKKSKIYGNINPEQIVEFGWRFPEDVLTAVYKEAIENSEIMDKINKRKLIEQKLSKRTAKMEAKNPKILELGINAKIRGILEKERIVTLADILMCSEDYLKEIPDMRNSYVIRIMEVVHKRGLLLDKEENTEEQETRRNFTTDKKPEEILIEEIGFSYRTTNGLKRSGIYTLADLLERNLTDITNIRMFGAKTIKELIIVMERMGLTLKEEKIEVRKRKTRTKTKRSNNDKTEDVKVKNKSTQQPEELQKNEAKPKSEQVIKQKKSKYTNKQIFEISQKLFLEFCQNDISEERKSEIKQEFYSLFEEIDEDNKVKIRAKLYKFINSKDNRHNKKMKKALVEISQRNNDIDLDL